MQERLDARFVILGDARRRGEAQPLLPGIREQHGAAHSVRLLLDQLDQGLENLPQRCAVRDALEHPALAVEKCSPRPSFRRECRHPSTLLPVLMPARARSSNPVSLARRAASRSPAWAATMEPIITICNCRANASASLTPASAASCLRNARIA